MNTSYTPLQYLCYRLFGPVDEEHDEVLDIYYDENGKIVNGSAYVHEIMELFLSHKGMYTPSNSLFLCVYLCICIY